MTTSASTTAALGVLIARRTMLAGLAVSALPLAARSQGAGVGAGNQQPEITVDRARTAPIPIGIPNFPGSQLGADMAGVITRNLDRSGLFRPVTGAAGGDTGDTPNFQAWKGAGAQALVTGKVEGGGNAVRVEFRLYDVLPGQQIQGTAYTTTSTNWRRIAHIISDVIYERLLGEKGYFDTRVAYIAGTGPRDRRIKRLAIMDQDSANNRYLTDGAWLALTPRFHPTKDQIVYMSYQNNRPRVYTLDVGTGSQRLLGEYEGMTFAPRYSPDGNQIVMSVTRGAGSDIVVAGVGGGGGRQLTNSGAIDTSPCFSPDGAQVVFNSDRGGDQQLYVMDGGGGGVRRISFGRGRYATPVWSPRGDLIAFTRINGGTFGIGVMRPDGSGERILSESFSVEGPTFAPNGRVLMFFRSSAAGAGGAGYSSQLRSIDITGFNERSVPTPTDASDPAWSPL
ncbi:MAG TPA: Tol-Pal system beta propeller repeat protein TolB, partial [Acetobacteraceae bacterium]